MRICFVCLGNICRSPTAEGVFRKLAAEARLESKLVIDSAGTGSWHVGELPDSRSRAVAAKRGYDLTHRARKFTREDFDRFDLVLAMDRANYDNLMQLARGRSLVPSIRMLREFERGAPADAEVPDPYIGEGGFEDVLDICERACRGLLEHVRERV
ncbi:MAG: low molecular weight phosphotyrosine protein phosphatase [Kofleriaceae bacterium]|nr:low molecular weight phosphotyrosine protein phosphatase [Kofleriaceae bacterium]